jgi:hypothetical protein
MYVRVMRRCESLIGRDWGCNSSQIRPAARAYELSTGCDRRRVRFGRDMAPARLYQCNATDDSLLTIKGARSRRGWLARRVRKVEQPIHRQRDALHSDGM